MENQTSSEKVQLQNLNKQNFWDQLYKDCPNSVNHFCKWIDEYKKEVNWNHVFYNDSNRCIIKFHDIPIEMQMGILMRYLKERGFNCYYQNIQTFEETKKQIRTMFESLEGFKV